MIHRSPSTDYDSDRARIDLGDTQSLPIDVVTESIAIVARKGAGKTHLGRVLAEGIIEHHVPLVIIDPLDVWWGLRVSLDGKGEGLDVVIFGGSHADLPLTETAGPALADLLVDKGINAILVLDQLTQAAQRRFMAEFCTRLYERKGSQEHRTAMHLIIDEADAYAPQRVFPDAAKCVGAVDRIVRRGRSRGLGTTCITQRPAVLSKDILTQTEILISLQVTAPQDRKALQEWINANATKEQAKAYLESLASMGRGEAWVWSPAKLKCFYRVRIKQTQTFDSSFTPAVGKARVSPTLKQLDLEGIRRDLDAVVQRAADNDPKDLKARLVGMYQSANSLQKMLNAVTKQRDELLACQGNHHNLEWLARQIEEVANAAAGDKAKQEPIAAVARLVLQVAKGFGLPTVTADPLDLERLTENAIRARDVQWTHLISEQYEAINHEVGRLPGLCLDDPAVENLAAARYSRGAVGMTAGTDADDRDRNRSMGQFHMGPTERTPSPSEVKRMADKLLDVPPGPYLMKKAEESLKRDGISFVAGDGQVTKRARDIQQGLTFVGERQTTVKLSKAERAILTVLMQSGGGSDIARIAAIAGYSPKGGGFQNAISALRSSQRISTGSGVAAINAKGAAAIGPVAPMPVGRELLDYWCSKLGKAERSIIVTLSSRPEMSKAQIAQATGYAVDGGGFQNALSALRTKGLISGTGTITLARELQ